MLCCTLHVVGVFVACCVVVARCVVVVRCALCIVRCALMREQVIKESMGEEKKDGDGDGEWEGEAELGWLRKI